MLEWLNANIAYWHWIVFGLLLILTEIITVSFILLWFGVSAILVGVLLWLLPISLTMQLLIWTLLSLFNVFGWFKWVSPHLKNKTLSGMAKEKMIGQIGTVIDYNPVQPERGLLRFPAPILGNDEWQFICSDEIEVGSRVIVKEFSGNTLIVNSFK
jgi:membrane protein implicated in regulation of membrane protease activity